MKKLILIFALIINLIAFSQDEKTVTLVVSGQGKTQDEAKQNALRSAIEQAFGTFISSKTEILNDNLVKDEIVSISNGNIQKFDIISQVQIPNSGYATTLKATVSVTKLTSFVESKGVEVEFKGSLFGANIKQQKLNEEAEYKAILNLCETSNEILSNSLDFSIEASEPKKAEGYEFKKDDYEVLMNIKISPNSNFDMFVDFFFSTIKSIAMSLQEQENYIKLNKDIYVLRINNKENKYFFRNYKTLVAFQNLFIKSNQYIHNFEVETNLDTFKNTKNWYNRNLGDRFKPGFPDFIFISEAQESYNTWKIPSQAIYFEYLSDLTNSKIFLDRKTYFTETGTYYREYCEYGLQNDGHKTNYPGNMNIYNSKNLIGELRLGKKDYYCTFAAIFSEEKLSKTTKIFVKKIK